MITYTIMSFRRAQSRTVNQNTYLDNRLTTFTNPHIYDGDLHVERDQTIGGNLTIGKDLRATNFYATGNYHLDTFVLIPAGTIIMSACIAEPGGWLDCDGRLFTVTVYPDLFSAIGYSFGGVDNSFNLPDMRGRAGVGLGQGAGLTTRALGATGGAETHTLSGAEMPSHNHGVTDPGHSHSYINNTNDQNTDNVFGTETAADQAELNKTTGSSFTNITIDLSGGSAAHNNMQPFVVLRYLIKY
jgi:microcystin-dependent protein